MACPKPVHRTLPRGDPRWMLDVRMDLVQRVESGSEARIARSREKRDAAGEAGHAITRRAKADSLGPVHMT
ncbi:MAG: hypothetical protein CL933_20940 [Deltaproteobacteria bacterium]|nr:hypothetical protein [Deltaproteobacteria bacterium]